LRRGSRGPQRRDPPVGRRLATQQRGLGHGLFPPHARIVGVRRPRRRTRKPPGGGTDAPGGFVAWPVGAGTADGRPSTPPSGTGFRVAHRLSRGPTGGTGPAAHAEDGADRLRAMMRRLHAGPDACRHGPARPWEGRRYAAAEFIRDTTTYPAGRRGAE
jgi:hypothetical protein